MHEDTKLEHLLSFLFTVDPIFYPITEGNSFTKDHYSGHFVLPLESTVSEPKIVQTTNALIFWLDIVHVQVNDLYTHGTDNIPDNHYNRTFIYTIRTLDYQLNHLVVNVHDVFEPCLALEPEKHNERDELKMNEHLEKRFEIICQMFDNLKKTLKLSTPFQSATTTTDNTSMQRDLKKCTTTTRKLPKTFKKIKTRKRITQNIH